MNNPQTAFYLYKAGKCYKILSYRDLYSKFKG
nr:MAG TPA: hypothetical protein [Caudoviricetes sp.]